MIFLPPQQKKGFTVLYAMLIASVLLSVGLSMYNIMLKELELSASTSDSQIAIFAADSGVECALYWDLKGGSNGESIFATSTAASYGTPAGLFPCGPNPNYNNIYLNGEPTSYNDNSYFSNGNSQPVQTNQWIVDTVSSLPAANTSSVPGAVTTFTVYLNASLSDPSNGSCAVVVVTKYLSADSNDNVSVSGTEIQAYGYNTCELGDPRRVERGLETNY